VATSELTERFIREFEAVRGAWDAPTRVVAGNHPVGTRNRPRLLQDMTALGVLRPSAEPRATAYVDQMIASIQVPKGDNRSTGHWCLRHVRVA
jgi:hypothetical protein